MLFLNAAHQNVHGWQDFPNHTNYYTILHHFQQFQGLFQELSSGPYPSNPSLWPRFGSHLAGFPVSPQPPSAASGASAASVSSGFAPSLGDRPSPRSAARSVIRAGRGRRVRNRTSGTERRSKGPCFVFFALQGPWGAGIVA